MCVCVTKRENERERNERDGKEIGMENGSREILFTFFLSYQLMTLISPHEALPFYVKP